MKWWGVVLLALLVGLMGHYLARGIVAISPETPDFKDR